MPRVHIPFRSPVGLKASNTAVEEFTRKVLDQTGLPPQGRLSPRAVLKTFGGKALLEEHSEIQMDVYGPKDFTIYYGPLGSAARDNITIAKMLGHYLLHYPAIMKDHPGSGMQVIGLSSHELAPDQDASREAMAFAVELLMPENELRKHFAEGGVDCCMARMYPLHKPYLESRLQRFGLLQADQVAA